MYVEIVWLERRVVQSKELIKCGKGKKEWFTMNSPIYQAIADNTFCLDLGYGVHHFTVRELNTKEVGLEVA